jgi:hypothetical protein
MAKKYQVFVSSTYLDMKEERQAAVMAILGARHIPAGMELFAAGNEEQWETIKRWIDDSDVFMLILGGRYGSIEPKSKLSYIECEYDYAVTQGKFLITLVAKDSYLHGKKATNDTLHVFEYDSESQKKFDFFKSKVLKKISAIFDSPDKIALEIHKSLKDAESENIPGWIRESEQQDVSEILNELNRIKNERDDLQSQLQVSGTKKNLNDELDSIIEKLENNIVGGEDSLFDCFVNCQNDLIKGVANPVWLHDSTLESEFLWNTIIPQLEKYGLMEKSTKGSSKLITDLGRRVLVRIEELENHN